MKKKEFKTESKKLMELMINSITDLNVTVEQLNKTVSVLLLK